MFYIYNFKELILKVDKLIKQMNFSFTDRKENYLSNNI